MYYINILYMHIRLLCYLYILWGYRDILKMILGNIFLQKMYKYSTFLLQLPCFLWSANSCKKIRYMPKYLASNLRCWKSHLWNLVITCDFDINSAIIESILKPLQNFEHVELHTNNSNPKGLSTKTKFYTHSNTFYLRITKNPEFRTH